MQYRLSAHRAANPPPLNAAAFGQSFPSLGFASDDVPCSSNLVLAFLVHELRALEYALGSSAYHDLREEIVDMFFRDEACWYSERDDAPKGHAWMPLTSDRAAAGASCRAVGSGYRRRRCRRGRASSTSAAARRPPRP